MSVAAYTLVFQGKILDGFEPSAVKEEVGKLFKLNADKLEEMFSLPRVVLKRNLGFDEAAHFREALHRMGLAVSLEPGPPIATAPRSAPASAPAFAHPAAAPPAARTADEAHAPAATRPFEFRGQGFEFFKIWIVNILLTIITLGIYSAWAKVRTQRYFYGNTRLDDASFEYLADPIRILKGRLIAFAFFLAYTLSNKFMPLLGVVFFALFLILLPWVMVRALKFRNHYSAWRGVRFGFDGSWGESAKAFLLWPLLGLFTIGLLMPYAIYRQQRFIIGNGRYGNAPFMFDAPAIGFYKVILMSLGPLAAGGLIAAIALPTAPFILPFVIVAAYLGAFVVLSVLMANLRFNHTALGPHRLQADYRLGSYAMLMLTNTVGLVLTLGLFYPWAKVRNARYAAEHTRVLAVGDLEGFAATQHKEVSAVGAEVGDLFDLDFGF